MDRMLTKVGGAPRMQVSKIASNLPTALVLEAGMEDRTQGHRMPGIRSCTMSQLMLLTRRLWVMRHSSGAQTAPHMPEQRT